MILRTLGTAVLCVALLSACGDDPEPEQSLDQLLEQLDQYRGAELEETIQAIGRLGVADPESVVPRLIDRMRDERLDPLVLNLRLQVDLAGAGIEPARYADACKTVVRILAARLRNYGYGTGTFKTTARSDVIDLRVPRPHPVEPDPDDPTGQKTRYMRGDARNAYETRWLRTLLGRLEEPGTFSLQIVVDPPEENAEVASLWKGSRESFDRFVEEETPRLEKAFEERRAYESPRSDFALARLRPAQPGGPVRRVVLRQPLSDSERFGTSNISVRRGRDTETDQLHLVLTVNDDEVDAIRAWSEQHIGRGLALVANGRTELVVPLREPLGKTIALGLGPASDPQVRTWMEGIMVGISSVPLPYVLRGEVASDLPPGLLTPAVRALAAVGEPAAPYLVKLTRDEGEMGERATRALEHLRRRLLTPAPNQNRR